MKAKDTAGRLWEMRNDTDAGVIIAAAHALITLGDNRGFNVYYAILTGELKSDQGLLAEQQKMLNDPKKLAQFGFEQGIGFIPFAGLGYGAFKMVLAAAALMLVKDPDPKSGQALATAATGNKSWIVRAAALNAIALRGETSLRPAAESGLQDDKEEVRYSAAAAVIRLTDLSGRRAPAPAKGPAPKPAPKKK
jgi:HEAT repeat protein